MMLASTLDFTKPPRESFLRSSTTATRCTLPPHAPYSERVSSSRAAVSSGGGNPAVKSEVETLSWELRFP